MKRRILFTAMTASCLLASTAVDAQRYSAPAYRPPPPPPPSYAPPPPRYTPPPASNQNTRQGSQTGGTYQGTQQRSDNSGPGGYRPGSIANSNSHSGGKESGGASAAGSARITGPSAQSGTGSTTKSTGSGTKSAGSGTAKQAGATGFGKASAPANDKGKAAGKGGPKVAAAGAGAGLFAAQGATGNAAKSSTPTSPAIMGGKKVGDKTADSNKKQPPTDEHCRKYPKSATCQFNCASIRPRPSYCPDGDGSQAKTETPQQVSNREPPASARLP